MRNWASVGSRSMASVRTPTTATRSPISARRTLLIQVFAYVILLLAFIALALLASIHVRDPRKRTNGSGEISERISASSVVLGNYSEAFIRIVGNTRKSFGITADLIASRRDLSTAGFHQVFDFAMLLLAVIALAGSFGPSPRQRSQTKQLLEI